MRSEQFWARYVGSSAASSPARRAGRNVGNHPIAFPAEHVLHVANDEPMHSFDCEVYERPQQDERGMPEFMSCEHAYRAPVVREGYDFDRAADQPDRAVIAQRLLSDVEVESFTGDDVRDRLSQEPTVAVQATGGAPALPLIKGWMLGRMLDIHPVALTAERWDC